MSGTSHSDLLYILSPIWKVHEPTYFFPARRQSICGLRLRDRREVNMSLLCRRSSSSRRGRTSSASRRRTRCGCCRPSGGWYAQIELTQPLFYHIGSLYIPSARCGAWPSTSWCTRSSPSSSSPPSCSTASWWSCPPASRSSHQSEYNICYPPTLTSPQDNCY